MYTEKAKMAEIFGCVQKVLRKNIYLFIIIYVVPFKVIKYGRNIRERFQREIYRVYIQAILVGIQMKILTK